MTESVEDLAVWLTAVWDEEERLARLEKQLADDFFPDAVVDYQWVRFVRDIPGGMARSSSFSPGAPSPASVLARIAADRKILALHVGGVSFPDECGLCNEPLPCETVRLLASPYADREGFSPGWLVERQGVEQ